MKTTIYLTIIITILALILGFLLAGRDNATADARTEAARIENQARAEKLAVDVQTKRRLQPWIMAAKIGGGLVVLAGVAGAIAVTLRFLDWRASEVHADKDGQFPLVRVRVAGATVIHDPNRQLAGATVYIADQLTGNVQVMPVVVGDLDYQERTSARATAVQLVSAAHKHPPALPAGKGRTATKSGTDVSDIAESASVITWPSRVPLSGLLNGQSTSLRRLVLGVTVGEDGQRSVVTGDMSKLVHIAVGGSSGWGKSVFLRSLAYQLATCAERPELALVDLGYSQLDPIGDTESVAVKAQKQYQH
jgi:hypothetical protein